MFRSVDEMWRLYLVKREWPRLPLDSCTAPKDLGVNAVNGVASTVFDAKDRRKSERFVVTVPAFIRSGDKEFTAKLANLVRDGAMIKTTAPVEVGSRIALRCGTVIAEAVAVWTRCGCVGIKFHTPLSDSQLQEQFSRSAALAARAAKR